MCLLFGISNKGGTTTPRPFRAGVFCFINQKKGEGEISDESRTFGTIKIGARFR